MTDIFTKEKRSELMRKVRNKNTNIELLLRKELFKNSHRFRIRNKLFGKPDIVFPRQRIAIFCDGDFWHGKNYRKEMKNYKQFWKNKILANINRDKTVNKRLKEEGWTVLRFWKADLLRDLEACVRKVEANLSKL